MNKVMLIGRLAKDPELRYTANGIPVANFTIAVDRPFTNKQGERETDFIFIVVWRKIAENCANNLAKGRRVGVSGMLQVRSFETQDGQRRWVTEVVADQVEFLDWPKGQGQQDDSYDDNSNIPDPDNEVDDGLPF